MVHVRGDVSHAHTGTDARCAAGALRETVVRRIRCHWRSGRYKGTGRAEATATGAERAPSAADATIVDAPSAAEATVVDAPSAAEATVVDAPSAVEATVVDAPSAAEATVVNAPSAAETTLAAGKATLAAEATFVDQSWELVIRQGRTVVRIGVSCGWRWDASWIEAWRRIEAGEGMLLTVAHGV